VIRIISRQTAACYFGENNYTHKRMLGALAQITPLLSRRGSSKVNQSLGNLTQSRAKLISHPFPSAAKSLSYNLAIQPSQIVDATTKILPRDMNYHALTTLR